MRELLSLDMRANSSAIVEFPATAILAAGERLVVGTARRGGLFLYRSVHPAGRRRTAPACSSAPAARWWPRFSPQAPSPSPGSARRAASSGRAWPLVAGGIVVGFPLLTSFALSAVPASHGAVVIALLPAATATMAVLRGRERPASGLLAYHRASARWRRSPSPPRSPAASGNCTGQTCCSSVPSLPQPSDTPRAACSHANSAPGRPSRGRSSSPLP